MVPAGASGRSARSAPRALTGDAKTAAVNDHYSSYYTAARQAGWTTTQLEGMGYPDPPTRSDPDTERNTADSTPHPTGDHPPAITDPAAADAGESAAS